MSREIPEEWAAAMSRRGFTDRGRPSVSALAREAEVAVETVRRMVRGIGQADQLSVNKVADALGVSRIELNRWIGVARTVEESYEPPADADLMDHDQRKAVDRVIQLFVDDKKEGEGHGSSAPIRGAGGPGTDDLGKRRQDRGAGTAKKAARKKTT